MLNKKYLSVLLMLQLVVLICFTNSNAQKTDVKNDENEAEYILKCNQECGKDIFLKELSPRFLHRFGIINYEEETAELDNFLGAMYNNSAYTAYIVVYGGKTNKYGEIDERVKRIKDYIAMKKFPPDRIKFVQGGFKEKFEFEFWTSRVPDAYPPLSPTIPLEKVIFKGKMKPLCDNELVPCN